MIPGGADILRIGGNCIGPVFAFHGGDHVLHQFTGEGGCHLHLFGQGQKLGEAFGGIIGSRHNDQRIKLPIRDHVVQQALKRRFPIRIQMILRASAGGVEDIQDIILCIPFIVSHRQIHCHGFDFLIPVRYDVAHLFHPPGPDRLLQILLRQIVHGELLLGQHGKPGALRIRGKPCASLKRIFFPGRKHFFLSGSRVCGQEQYDSCQHCRKFPQGGAFFRIASDLYRIFLISARNDHPDSIPFSVKIIVSKGREHGRAATTCLSLQEPG